MNSRNTKSKREKLKNFPLEKLEGVHGGCQAHLPRLVLALLNPLSRIYFQLYYFLNIENTKKDSQVNEENVVCTKYSVDVVEEIKKRRIGACIHLLLPLLPWLLPFLSLYLNMPLSTPKIGF